MSASRAQVRSVVFCRWMAIKFVPNCSPALKAWVLRIAILGSLLLFFRMAGLYNRSIALRYQACSQAAIVAKRECSDGDAVSAPSCIQRASVEEERCLDTATDPGSKRAEVLSLLA